MRVRVGTDVAAPPEQVFEVFADYERWPEIFPTIRAVRRVGGEPGTVVLEVDHVEGRVPNTMTLAPPHRIVLDERKKRYDARFVNTFTPSAPGTRFEIEGDIRIRGIRRVLAPLVRPYVRRSMRRLSAAPVKAAAERRWAERHPGLPG